jgi:hypothetical protein
MRVLLYDTESQQYFRAPQAWTPDPDQAKDLRGTVQAVTVAFQNRMKAAEIILAFDDRLLRNMRLPLSVGT